MFWKNKHILIAEDEESNFFLLKEIISPSGAKVTWTTNGLELLEALAQFSDIDIVILDIKMPVKNGYETIVELRKTYPNIPVIAQTAYAIIGEREKCLQLGFTDYIAKPIFPQDFMNLIGKYL